jgi:hypothetical protein
VAAEYEAEIPEISVDPRDVPLAAVRRIAKLRFPSLVAESATASIVRDSKRFEGLIRNRDWDTLNSGVADMESGVKRLTIPAPAPTFEDQLREYVGTFLQMSWTSHEYDALRGLWRPDDRISEIGISSVKLGDRMAKRAEVRERLKNFCTNAQLDQMARQEKEAIELEAENRLRSARGEERRHRSW